MSATLPTRATTGITQRLAEHVANLDSESLPAATIDQAKKAILDLLGIAIRASTEAGSTSVIRAVVDGLGGRGSTTAIGIGAEYAPQYAALLNGAFAHTLDFDDTHAGGSLHPGAPIIPAALAVAEEIGASGARFISGVVAGYDTTVRISEAARPAVHYARGFHPTATAGTFGASAAVANVSGASAETLEHAFGINGSQAAGSLQFLANGSWNKRLHVGLTAHNGILAYRFAAAGFIGASEALEGPNGFFHAYTDNADPALVTHSLGERFAIDETAFKPYPSCRYSHVALDIILEMLKKHTLHANAIERVRIGLTQTGMGIIGIPDAYKRTPTSIIDGQFSMYFSAAAALLRGGLAWDDYELLGDPRVAAMIEKIDVFADPAAEHYAPRMGATVEITANGRVYRDEGDTPRGEPERPLHWNEVIAKFDELAAAYTQARRTSIVQIVRELDTLANVRVLTALLGGPHP